MKPQRAEAILNKIQMSFEAEYREPKPDVVSFNALINAYGWSFEKGKAVKCFAILERMIALGQSRKNPAAKPDIITCNSILNACAYSEASSESERAELMDIVVQTYEIFQTAAPTPIKLPMHKFSWLYLSSWSRTSIDSIWQKQPSGNVVRMAT
jgi:hypothetical protein